MPAADALPAATAAALPARCRRAAAAAVAALPAAVLALMTPRCRRAAAKLPSWPLPTRVEATY